MRKICVFAALFALLIPIPSLLYAEDTDTAEIEQLIQKYGVRPLVSAVLAVRGSAITIDVNGELRPMMGPPDEQFVSARSILADLRIAGLTVASFAARIPAVAAAEKAVAERVTAARGRVAVRREVLVPSAVFGPITEDPDRQDSSESWQRDMEDTRRRVEEHNKAIQERQEERERAQAEWLAAQQEARREYERIKAEQEKVEVMRRQARALEQLQWEMQRQNQALENLRMQHDSQNWAR